MAFGLHGVHIPMWPIASMKYYVTLFLSPHLFMETGKICILRSSSQPLCGERIMGGSVDQRKAVLVAQA
jgi:hypothetical protein